MTTQQQEYSPQDIAEAITRSYTGEICDDTLEPKDICQAVGFCALNKEEIWKQ